MADRSNKLDAMYRAYNTMVTMLIIEYVLAYRFLVCIEAINIFYFFILNTWPYPLPSIFFFLLFLIIIFNYYFDYY